MKLNLIGKTYGTIYIDSQAPTQYNKTYWNCHCIICGQQKIIQGARITSGKTKSCGCGHFSIEENGAIICEICGKKFEFKNSNDARRKYCYECSPSYLNGIITTISQLRKAMKQEAVKRMGGACSKCGYNKSIRALHFHHKNPTEKKFGLSQNGPIHSWAEYWSEAQKCDLLCANCHAEIHDELELKKQKLKE